jgi:TolB protein
MKRALLPIAVVAALLSIAAPTGAVFPGANARVLFTSDRSGAGDIFTVRPDGTDLRTVIGGPAQEAQAAWSPDGRRIAFRRGPNAASEVWLANADGSGQRVLTNAPPSFYSSQPAWSPDGRVFFRSDRDGDADIWVVNADGSDEHQQLDLPGDQRYPTPSPDGRLIAYRSDADGDAEIWVSNIDGTQPRALTSNDLFDSAPSWSPDGRRMAFERTVDGNTDVYVMDDDGGRVRRLTSTPALDEGPVFSPDAEFITFTTERDDGNSEIYVMRSDGSDQRPLSPNPAREESPDWQSIPITDQLPKIDLQVRPRRATVDHVASLRFAARVMRGGSWEPLPGATVRFAGRKAKTGQDGRARIRKLMRRPGLFTARASLRGYRSGIARVRVRRRPT